MQRILITGGAGFIGSHLTDELLASGYEVRVLDNLTPQVHGPNASSARYLNGGVDFRLGDVRDRAAVDDALERVDAVVHLAAAVGVGQSMYEIREYTSVNNLGTATLLEALAKRPVRRLVVASSMSIYGEGAYRSDENTLHESVERTVTQLKRGEWEPMVAGRRLKPVPTPESKAPQLASVYALSKFDQERLCMTVGRAYGIPTVALRLFNTFGARQALSNPYTGVLAIFAARLLNRRPPLVFEDGRQQRDFVDVHDVARAFKQALESEAAPGHAINVGSGRATTIREIAEKLARAVGAPEIGPEITERHRVGDVRHCFADITLARSLLGYTPRMSLEGGLAELTSWLRDQSADDRADQAHAELERRGLTL